MNSADSHKYELMKMMQIRTNMHYKWNVFIFPGSNTTRAWRDWFVYWHLVYEAAEPKPIPWHDFHVLAPWNDKGI